MSFTSFNFVSEKRADAVFATNPSLVSFPNAVTVCPRSFILLKSGIASSIAEERPDRFAVCAWKSESVTDIQEIALDRSFPFSY